MKTLVPVLLVAALVWVGCAGKEKPIFNSPPGPSPGMAGSLPAPPPPPPVTDQKKSSAKKSELIVTPESALIGKVAVYNEAGRFVVVDFPINHLPAVDQRMFVYRRGLKVGEVKITGQKLENHVVADLTSGEAQSGDEVRDK